MLKTESIINSLISKGTNKFDGTLFNQFQNRMTELLSAAGLEKFLIGEEIEPLPPAVADQENPTAAEVRALKAYADSKQAFNQRRFLALCMVKTACDQDHQAMAAIFLTSGASSFASDCVFGGFLLFDGWAHRRR